MYRCYWRFSHIPQNHKGQRQRQVAPYVTRGGGDILSGVLPPLLLGVSDSWGATKRKPERCLPRLCRLDLNAIT